MKKKVIILAMVTAMCSAALLAGCGEEPTQQASAVEIPSSSQSFDDNTNEVDSMASSPIFNVDWDRCINETKEYSLMVTSNYPYVKDVYINVDDNEKEILFTAVFDDSTNPELALDYADTMIRQLNMFARMQDETIASSTKDYYGGLYDVYSIKIGITPLSQVKNQSKWFISDYINKGLHTKHTIKLEKAYRE